MEIYVLHLLCSSFTSMSNAKILEFIVPLFTSTCHCLIKGSKERAGAARHADHAVILLLGIILSCFREMCRRRCQARSDLLIRMMASTDIDLRRCLVGRLVLYNAGVLKLTESSVTTLLPLGCTPLPRCLCCQLYHNFYLSHPLLWNQKQLNS